MTDTSTDAVTIDLRAVMLEQIEEAAAQSPWVPPEYTMNEVVSDCCAFLRADQPDPAKVQALVDALDRISVHYTDTDLAAKHMGAIARAALAAWKEGK